MAMTSDIRSGISNFVQDAVRSLFGRDKPVELQQYLNKHTHKDAQVFKEYISFNGRRYSYEYVGPTDAEVQKAAGGATGSSIPRGTLVAQAREKIATERRLAAQRAAASIITSYLDYLESVKYSTPGDRTAEVGISRRMKEIQSFDDFASGSGVKMVSADVGHLGYFFDPVHEAWSDDAVKNMTLSSLVDEINLGIDKIRETRREGRDGADEDLGIQPARFIDGASHVKHEIYVQQPSENPSDTVGDAFHRLAMDFGGYGNKDYQFLEQLKYLNRFGKTTAAAPKEMPGFTFITRPHLNLSNQNLVHLRNFYPLLYASNNSVQMYIRQMLDTSYCKANGGLGGQNECPFIDVENAFNTLLCNSLKSINGFPDPDLTTESTAGGFFSEQQTNVIGYNRLAKGQDLQLEFRDYIGGPVLAMHDYWCQYMGNIADGSMCQYMDDIESNLMGYTVSIYRFITDHTGRIITRWAKATGCFPKMQPTGTPFNVNQNEKTIEAVKTFTIPYWCHHFGYNDPAIISEFNTLVGRYKPSLNVDTSGYLLSMIGPRAAINPGNGVELGPFIRNGHHGTPFILQPEPGVFELAWVTDKPELTTATSSAKPIMEGVTNVVPEYPMYPAGEDGKHIPKIVSGYTGYGEPSPPPTESAPTKEKSIQDKIIDGIKDLF